MVEERSSEEAPLKEKAEVIIEAPSSSPPSPPAVEFPAPPEGTSETTPSQRKRPPRDPYRGEDVFIVPKEIFGQRGRIFSIINQKGGCGKTTTAINLSASLAKEGFQVLLIDLDPQVNASLGLGLRLEPGSKTAYDIFQEPNTPSSEVVHSTCMENLHVIPASKYLASLAVELLKVPNWEYLLRGYIRSFRYLYHFILIDCPPALNALAVNALTASDDMIIPLQTHYFSLEGLKELFLTVQSVRERLNPLLGNGRILATLFDKRTRISREMLASIRDYFKEQVFETVIGVNVRLIESVMHGQPVLMHDPSSAGARDYRYLGWEFLLQEAALKKQEVR